METVRSTMALKHLGNRKRATTDTYVCDTIGKLYHQLNNCFHSKVHVLLSLYLCFEIVLLKSLNSRGRGTWSNGHMKRLLLLKYGLSTASTHSVL